MKSVFKGGPAYARLITREGVGVNVGRAIDLGGSRVTTPISEYTY